MINRKDLLEVPRPSLTPDQESKLRSEVELANALTAMQSTRGWQLLEEKFIKPHTNYDSLMVVPDDKLSVLRAEHRALYDMIRFIEKAKENGHKAYETLLKNK